MKISEERKSIIARCKSESSTCPACKKTEVHEFQFRLSHYVLLGLIPMPFSQNVVAHCSSCGFDAKSRVLSTEDRRLLLRFKKGVGLPFKHYWGALTVPLFFLGFGLYMFLVEKNSSKKCIADPKVGDVYVVEIPTKFFEIRNAYTLWKVDSVLNDSVWYFENTMKISDQRDWYDISKYEYYQRSSLVMRDRNELLNLFKEGKIVGAHRGSRLENLSNNP